MFSYHMASFMRAPAALLNKSEWLASVLSHSSPSPPPPPLPPSHAASQKRQTPTVDSAHVRGLIRIVVPWWQGTVRPARECVAKRRVRGRLKSPDPEKESRWQQELPHSWTAPVLPTHPSLSSYSTSVHKALWGLWSGRMSQCWACPRGIRSQGPCWLLCNTARFTNTLSQTGEPSSCFTARSVLLLLSTERLADNKQKQRGTTTRRGKTLTTTNCR